MLATLVLSALFSIGTAVSIPDSAVSVRESAHLLDIPEYSVENPYTNNCTSITLKENWLIADCANTTGFDNSSTTSTVRSTVYLPNWIGSRAGKLIWQKDGHYEVKLLNACSLNNDTVLDCSFHWPNGTGIMYSSSLNLTECIASREGILFNCLDDWDKVPKDPQYDVPSNFTISGGLISSNCSMKTALTITTNRAPEGQGCSAWYSSGRRAQYRDAVYFASPNPGWELIAYNAPNCIGEIARIGPDQGNKCVKLTQRVSSFVLRPLWYAGSYTPPYVSPAKLKAKAKTKKRTPVTRGKGLHLWY